ncbi:MAG: O-antigen/teichoic acid export membrane protein [Psychromonas sp.]|jgi:O-antigen/teichoic acid export membrane protein|uniref:lipopolysaccharide biosynthesis protein n=1 Tax=Psychromonas sp. TaxID=1884585 RepID=UPI0039E48D4F
MLHRFLQLRHNELIRSSALILFFKVLIAAAGFLISAIITRQLGAEVAGHYFFTLSFIAIVAVFVKQGSEQAVTRFVASANDVKTKSLILKSWLKPVFSMSLAVIAVMVVVLFSLKRELSTQWLYALTYGSVALILVPLYAVINQAHLGQKNYFNFSFSSLSVRLSHVTMLIVMLFTANLGVEMALVSFLLANLVALLFVFVKWEGSFKKDTAQLNSQLVTEMAKTKSSLWIASILTVLSIQMVPFILGNLGQLSEVSYFAVSYQLTMMVGFIVMSVSHAISPDFSNSFSQKDFVGLQQSFLKARKLMIISCGPIVIGLIVAAELLLSFFGDGFESATPVLRVLLLGKLVNLAVGPAGQLLVMSGNEKTYKNNVSIGFAVLVSIGVVSTYRWGAIGGAWAITISMLVSNLLSFLQVKKYFNSVV